MAPACGDCFATALPGTCGQPRRARGQGDDVNTKGRIARATAIWPTYPEIPEADVAVVRAGQAVAAARRPAHVACAPCGRSPDPAAASSKTSAFAGSGLPCRAAREGGSYLKRQRRSGRPWWPIGAGPTRARCRPPSRTPGPSALSDCTWGRTPLATAPRGNEAAQPHLVLLARGRAYLHWTSVTARLWPTSVVWTGCSPSSVLQIWIFWFACVAPHWNAVLTPPSAGGHHAQRRERLGHVPRWRSSVAARRAGSTRRRPRPSGSVR